MATIKPVTPAAGGVNEMVDCQTPSVPVVAWLDAVALPNTLLFASWTCTVTVPDGALPATATVDPATVELIGGAVINTPVVTPPS